MRVAGMLPHRWVWDFEDLKDLPDDGSRCEIVDGGLVVSPPPPLRHEFVVEQLKILLRGAAPALWRVLSPGVHLGATYRVPDVLVLRAGVDRSAGTAEPADVLLAVEVVSAGSTTNDRITKPVEYAAAGIPHFWRVDLLREPLLEVFTLAGATHGSAAAGQRPTTSSSTRRSRSPFRRPSCSSSWARRRHLKGVRRAGRTRSCPTRPTALPGRPPPPRPAGCTERTRWTGSRPRPTG